MEPLGGAGTCRSRYAKRLSAKGRFIGIDQDQDAIVAASERLAALWGPGDESFAAIIVTWQSELKRSLRHPPGGRQFCWILEFHPTSSTTRSAVLPTVTDAPLDMRMDQRAEPDGRRISSTATKKKNCTGSSVITEKINSQKILPNIIAAARQEAPIRTTGGADGDHPPRYTYEDTGSGRPSRQENFSGCPDRTEP